MAETSGTVLTCFPEKKSQFQALARHVEIKKKNLVILLTMEEKYGIIIIMNRCIKLVECLRVRERKVLTRQYMLCQLLSED